MADHLPPLPWAALGSNFTYIHSNPHARGVTELFPRPGPTVAEDINAFIRALVQEIKDHSVQERSKYPPTYDPPDDQDVMIDDETVRKITPFFRKLHKTHPHRYLGENRWEHGLADDNPSCRHPAEDRCRCLIPYEERRAGALSRPHQYNTCFQFWDVNGDGFRSWEIVRTLLVHGKMEPLLQLCAVPYADSDGQFGSWWDLCSCACEFGDGATSHLYEKTAMSFVCLQILRHHPDIKNAEKPGIDYRLTKMYQHTVRRVTKDEGLSDLPNIAHRYFYGIGDAQFLSVDPQPRDKERWAHLPTTERFEFEQYYPEGLVTYAELLSFEKVAEYRTHELDIEAVGRVLRRNHLPSEIIDEVLDLAEYRPKRRLEVDHDPLHEANVDVLEKYLEESWAIMIRCDVFAGAFDEEICWRSILVHTFEELFPDLPTRYVPEMVRSDDVAVEEVAVFVREHILHDDPSFQR